MKPLPRLRRILLAPLVYLAAVLLLLEDWLWDLSARLVARIAAWPPLRALEHWLGRLPAAAAMAVFALPALLLLPVKLLALFAIARGHAMWGLFVIIVAKVAGAALVARIYLITRPALMTIGWFAALLGWFIPLKERLIAQLRASGPWRDLQKLLSQLRAPLSARAGSRIGRLLRRLSALWRRAHARRH
jgi:hypothetical protein